MGVSFLLLRKSGRESFARLGLIIGAVALGVLLICYFMAIMNGLEARRSRAVINNAGYEASFDLMQGKRPPEGVAPLLITVGKDNPNRYREETITTFSMYAEPNSPQFKKIATPKPGEYYLSKKLAEINRQHPEEQIGQRYGTKYLGELPDEYTSSPDSLMVVRGASKQEVEQAQQVATEPGEAFIPVYKTDSEAKNPVHVDPIATFLAVAGSTTLLVPIVNFVAVASQLGSVQREKRYAALRLIGATKAQVNKILLLESLLAASIGIVIGVVIFNLVQFPLAEFTFADLHFWPTDFALSWLQYTLIVVLTLGLISWVSWRRMRRAQVSPLGVANTQAKAKPLRAWRLLPLLAGMGVVEWMALPAGKELFKSHSADQQMIASLGLVAAILAIMFGLMLAGGWLTNKIARLAASRARRPATLIAGKRVSMHSRAVFRSVGGVVLALFAGSFYLSSVSGIEALTNQAAQDNGYAKLNASSAMVVGGKYGFPAEMGKAIAEQPYVKHSAAVTALPEGGHAMTCQQLAEFTERRCPDGSTDQQLAVVNFDKSINEPIKLIKQSDIPANATKDYILTLQKTEDIDKLRSLVFKYVGVIRPFWVVSGQYTKTPHINPVITNFAQLAYVGMAVTLFVAVASLIVSTIGGLLERRRSLFTLRLSGMSIGSLQRLVLIESLVPLFVVSIIACCMGVWSGSVFISLLSSSLHPIVTGAYIAVVSGGLVAAVIGVCAVLPMLKKLTSPEANQTE